MRVLPILFLVAATTLGGCATTGDRASLDPRDPMEGFNRGMWDFNQGVDKALIKPTSQVYRAVTPVPARRGFSRLLANLTEPLNAINSLLQGRPDRAFNSLGRFLVNTTIGVGGLADHATDLGLPPTPEDFGQTLAVWGVKDSSYLVLPIFGPSTIRDAIGTGTEFAVVPINIVLDELGASSGVKYGVTGAQVLQVRSDAIDGGVDSLLETSADPYATARDAYFQRRAAEIANREGGSLSSQEEEQLLNQALEEGQAASEEPEGGTAESGQPQPAEADPAPQPPEPSPDGTPDSAGPQLSFLTLPQDEQIAY